MIMMIFHSNNFAGLLEYSDLIFSFFDAMKSMVFNKHLNIN